MPVPEDDILCRFIRPKDWSRILNRPKPGAFKQAALSVWHQTRLHERGASLTDLLIENLTGFGQAHHTAGDYKTCAREAEKREGEPFQVQVEWRSENQYVAEPWREWSYAHVQVEATKGPDQFLPEFRRVLAERSRVVIPPDL